MPLTPESIEKRLADDAERERERRQERHRAAQERADALEAREARWQARSEQERLRLGIIAHRAGRDPRDLTDDNNNQEVQR